MALSKINTNQIVDGAVATADIADGLITTAKLADGAVTTAKITDGNITTAKVADDAVTTAKVNPAQTDITSVGTLTGLTTSGDIDVQGNDIILDADNDTSIVASTDDQIDFKAGNKVRGSVNTTGLQVGGTSYFASPTLTFFDADSGVQAGTIGGRINFHTNDGTAQGVSAKIQAKYENANSNTSLSFETGSGGSTTEKMTLSSSGDLTARNSSTTGTSLTLGTTSTSVADGGYIGGILFTASTANSAVARIQALSNGQTDAGNTGTGADFSFECRNNNASFTEKARLHGSGEFTVNNQPFFHGGRQATTGSTSGYTEASGGGLDFVANVQQDNTGGYYNTGNGQFTCPVTGQYFVRFHAFIHPNDATTVYTVSFRIGGSDLAFFYIAHTNGSATFVDVSSILRCASTNVITTRLHNGLWYTGDWRYAGTTIYLLG